MRASMPWIRSKFRQAAARRRRICNAGPCAVPALTFVAKTRTAAFEGGCFVYAIPLICQRGVNFPFLQKKTKIDNPSNHWNFNIPYFYIRNLPRTCSVGAPWNIQNSRETCSAYTKRGSYMDIFVFLLAPRRWQGEKNLAKNRSRHDCGPGWASVPILLLFFC